MQSGININIIIIARQSSRWQLLTSVHLAVSFSFPFCIQCVAWLDMCWTRCKANLSLTSVCAESSLPVLRARGCGGARVHVARVCAASRTHRENDSRPYGPPAVVSRSKSTWSFYKSVPSRLVQPAHWDSSLSHWLASPHGIKSLAVSIRLINLNTCLCSDYGALPVGCVQSQPLEV